MSGSSSPGSGLFTLDKTLRSQPEEQPRSQSPESSVGSNVNLAEAHAHSQSSESERSVGPSDDSKYDLVCTCPTEFSITFLPCFSCCLSSQVWPGQSLSDYLLGLFHARQTLQEHTILQEQTKQHEKDLKQSDHKHLHNRQPPQTTQSIKPPTTEAAAEESDEASPLLPKVQHKHSKLQRSGLPRPLNRQSIRQHACPSTTSPSLSTKTSKPLHPSLALSRDARIRANKLSIAKLQCNIEHNRSLAGLYAVLCTDQPKGDLVWYTYQANVKFHSRQAVRAQKRVAELAKEVEDLKSMSTEEFVEWRRLKRTL